MRSIVLALALAAPCSAFAAPTATYTNPLTSQHTPRTQKVMLTFVGNTAQEREIRVGDTQYRIGWQQTVHIMAPVGSVVRLYSNQNSKVNGTELLQVSNNDTYRTIRVQ